MNQQFTDIINNQLDPILDQFTNVAMNQSTLFQTPLNIVRQSNVVEIQNVHTKYKRVIQEVIEKIIIEIEKYYQCFIEKNQAICLKQFQRVAELTSNMQQLQEIVNQLTIENEQYRNKSNEEEITQEFYDPQQFTIREQKKELLEQYELNDQLQTKLRRQESLNTRYEDKINRQNSQISYLEQKVKSLEQKLVEQQSFLSKLQQENNELQNKISQMQQNKQISNHKEQRSLNILTSQTRPDLIERQESPEKQVSKQEVDEKLISIPKIQRYLTTEQETITQPSQRYLYNKKKRLLAGIDQNNSDFEVKVKLRGQYQRLIQKNDLLDISDIIKPKYQKKPQDLDDLYLLSNRCRNSSVDYYYEPPPRQYRFNIIQKINSPLSIRNKKNTYKLSTLD